MLFARDDVLLKQLESVMTRLKAVAWEESGKEENLGDLLINDLSQFASL